LNEISSAQQDARNTVFRLLKIRLRSEQEIRLKLKLKHYEQNVIDETVKYFKQIRLIDDQQFTQGWISSRLTKPFGLKRIRYELKLKGIPEELLKEKISEVRDQYDEFEVVFRLAKSRFAKYKGLEERIAKQRIMGYLSRRGFDLSTIRQVVQKL
jgi:regulatory protein